MKRFAIIENELCLSSNGLVAAFTDAVSARNTAIKGAKRYRTGQSSSWAYYDTSDTRYFVISALPVQTKEKIVRYYGDLQSAYWTENLLGEVTKLILPGDARFFSGYNMPAMKVNNLVEACGWLRLGNTDWWQEKYGKRQAFLEGCVEILKERDLYGLRVSHYRSYDRKVAQWRESGYEALIHKSWGNNNAAKVTQDEAIADRVAHIYSSPLKPNVKKVHEIYIAEAADRGWPALCYESIRGILKNPHTSQIVFLARHGKDAARAKQERNILRKRPSFPDALWVLDGSTVQLYYQDEQGKPCSGLYGVAVVDACSQCIIGWAVGVSETSTLVQAAIRRAVRRTGMRPKQIQYDNSSANKALETRQVFDTLAKYHFPTAPYSGKSKIVEAVWGRMEQSFLHHFPNFKGGNITARSVETRANPDALAKLRKAGGLPTKEQVIAQFELAIETYNHTMVKSRKATRAELYKAEHTDRTECDYFTQVNAFWVLRREAVTYGNNGLQIEVDGQRLYYEVAAEKGVEDATFRMQWLGQKFQIRYDPDDLSDVALYSDDVYVATATQRYAAPMALADREEGDGLIIAKAQEARKMYWAQVEGEAEALNQRVEAQGFTPVDFRLLHKDALNRMEGAAVDELMGMALGAPIPTPKAEATRRPRARLYDDSEADGSIVQ